MAQLDEIYPNDLFRFVNVRSPQTPDLEQALIAFIPSVYQRLSATDLASVQQKIGTLYPALVALAEAPEAPAAQRAEADRYKGTADYIARSDDYAAQLPAVARFLAWLDAHAAHTTMRDVAAKFRESFREELGAFVASLDFKVLRCRLWDNLLAAVLSPGDPFLVTLACKHIGGLHLAEVAATRPDARALEPRLWQIYRAKALLPAWLYQRPASRDPKADAGVGDQPRSSDEDRGKDWARHQVVSLAVQDVRAFLQRRLEARRAAGERTQGRQPPEDGSTATDPFLLARDEPLPFASSTRALVDQLVPDWSALDLRHLLEALLGESTRIAARLGEEEREDHVRIGDAIISRKALCVDMDDQDPCAVTPRKPFVSRGSHVNGMLIGDLLVTRQQLIKYTPGEVAHVEALMAGLTKERTHRRLSRTESTTTHERESVNETERETQTTERFSMEKETTKTLAQDFAVSTGVNVSGTYGVTTVASNIDASFGISSTQSAHDAVKFSRDVTSRALTRVKELVRETQTVTVINETEETSLNKLVNGTADAQNGVYRWLDKFYLNKIVNYGKRLMLEFAVPEPANFYLFRKLAKPHVGAVMEKPIAPAELNGPGGKLTSPAVLTDTNYAFWVAQYGAAGVDAPPQEYLTFSRAFKSDTGVSSANDVFASTASEIPLDDGYEAVVAEAHIRKDVAGTTVASEALIGTTPFGDGFTGGIILPPIRRSVAVSIIAKGIQYIFNAQVTAKRSLELYEKWKLATYAKILDAYNQKQSAYEEWLNAQYADSAFGFSGGTNPEINRATEREELKKRCLELFTGQRWESFDAAVNGILNASGYPEILFTEAMREGNLARFFEQAFEWENMTYTFYPYFYGRKSNWLTIKNLEDAGDPLFAGFLQAGQARVMVPARPNFENFVLVYNLLANVLQLWNSTSGWSFTPEIFGALGVSSEFNVGITEPVYMSVTQELAAAAGMTMDSDGTLGNGPAVVGSYVQKVPTNLVYVMPTNPSTLLPGLPDNSADPDIAPWLL